MHVRFLSPDIAILHSRFWIEGEVLHDALSQPSRESVGMRVVHKSTAGGGSSRRRTPTSARAGGIRTVLINPVLSCGLRI